MLSSAVFLLPSWSMDNITGLPMSACSSSPAAQQQRSSELSDQASTVLQSQRQCIVADIKVHQHIVL
jgi:hypothetical protein